MTAPVMSAAFPRETSAWYYARYRPAYPDIVLDQLSTGPWFTPGTLVIDIGCGTGQLAIPLAARGAQVIAIDPSHDMLDEARARARASSSPEVNRRIRWVHGDGNDIERLVGETAEPGDPIGLVVFGKSFHLTDRERMLACCDRVIAPGGAIAIISGNWTHGRQPRWWDVIDDVLRTLVGRASESVQPLDAARARLPGDADASPDPSSEIVSGAQHVRGARFVPVGLAGDLPHQNVNPSSPKGERGRGERALLDLLRASAFSSVRCRTLLLSVARSLAEVIGLVASIPRYSPADLGVDRFELLASELYERFQREFGDETAFVEERTLDVCLALRGGEGC